MAKASEGKADRAAKKGASETTSGKGRKSQNESAVSGSADPADEKAPAGQNAQTGAESAAGEVSLPAAGGKAGVFGGPKDRSAKPDLKLALPTGPHFQYELVRNLNPKSYYCSMRWDYRQNHMSTEEGKRWWANRRLVVTNPANGKSVVVRAVDYGPHESTGLDISISPGAAEAIEINPGDEVQVKFAEKGTPLGPVQA